MPNLTYNLIIRDSDHNSVTHLRKIQELAVRYGATDMVVYCSDRRVAVLDLNKSLESRVNGGKPYGKLREVAVDDYESRVEQIDNPRFVIASPSVVEKVTNSLIRIGLVKNGIYFGIEVADVYGGRQTSIDKAISSVTPAKIQFQDGLADGNLITSKTDPEIVPTAARILSPDDLLVEKIKEFLTKSTQCQSRLDMSIGL